MMQRLVLSGLLIAVAITLSAVSGVVHRDLAHGNGLFILFPIQLLALPLGSALARRCLHSRRVLARGMLGVGVYLLMVASAVSTIYPMWLPDDDTILGSAVLAGLWAGVGANLALASAAILAGWSSTRMSIISGIGGVLTFLLVTTGGIVWPLFQLKIPLVAIVAAAIAALVIAHSLGLRLVHPIVLALAGGAGTLAVLLGRGPGDWASASHSLKLYGFPILLMAIGVSMALIDIVRGGNWPLDRGTQS